MTEPEFSLYDGASVPRRFGVLRAVATRGRVMRRLTLAGSVGRMVLEHLPTMTARYRDGRAFRIPAGDRTYGRIFFLAEHEPATSTVIRRLVRPGDFAIDAGANHGWFALLMAERAGASGEVWAIEPLPAAVEQLRINVELNGGLDVRVIELALGATSGTAEIHAFAGLPHVHASVATLGRSDFEASSVARETLDALLAGHRTPSLVKVDVEGAELEVLRGAERLLDSDAPPIWVLEANRATAAAFGHSPEDLLAHLRAHRPHEVFRIGRGGRLEPELDPASAPHGCNWLCVPAERRERLAPLLAGQEGRA